MNKNKRETDSQTEQNSGYQWEHRKGRGETRVRLRGTNYYYIKTRHKDILYSTGNIASILQ